MYAGAVSGSASPILSFLEELYQKYQPLTDGALASYIPELANVDPDRFGVAIVTADGFTYEVGDTGLPFTIQSISKAIIYGLALEDHGRDVVLRKIGVEPSGDPFNSISFDERGNRPFNPMVNAGAIAATALIKGTSYEHRHARMLDMFRAFIGRPVEIEESVYRSESATGHRNRAIAYLELNSGMIDGDVAEHLDLYFRQCSILVTARDLAVMGSTLANGGVNPLTGEQVLRPENVRDVLSVMTSCGMYDYAGEWEFRVGLPAKSGVGGGIMAVLPGQLGIGVFSPRLDDRGNSLRGIRLCEELASRLKLHMLDYRGSARTAIRRHYRGSQIRSKRMRRAAAARLLDQIAGAISVYELQGDLSFANAELVVRRVLQDIDGASHFVLDAERITSIDDVAIQLLGGLYETLTRSGKTVLFVPRHDMSNATEIPSASVAVDTDSALEFCEDALLAQAEMAAEPPSNAIALADIDLLEDFDADETATLQRYVAWQDYSAGEVVIREGTPADSVYFLVRGSVDIGIAMNNEGNYIRLGTVDAGNVFGEVALFGNAMRTADVIARSSATAAILSTDQFAILSASHPDLQRKLLTAIGHSLSQRLRKANAEIRHLAI